MTSSTKAILAEAQPFRARYWNADTVIEAGHDDHQVGSSGVLVWTHRAPRAGKLLAFELRLGSEPPLRGVVRVLFSSDARMAIRFVHLEDVELAVRLLDLALQASTRTTAPPPVAGAAPAAEPISTERSSLDDEVFYGQERASTPPVTIDEDVGVVESGERRRERSVRRRRLRLVVGAVLSLAAVLLAASGVRHGSGSEPPRAPAVAAPAVAPPPVVVAPVAPRLEAGSTSAQPKPLPPPRVKQPGPARARAGSRRATGGVDPYDQLEAKIATPRPADSMYE